MALIGLDDRSSTVLIYLLIQVGAELYKLWLLTPLLKRGVLTSSNDKIIIYYQSSF